MSHAASKTVPSSTFHGSTQKGFKPSVDIKRISDRKSWASHSPCTQHLQASNLVVLQYLHVAGWDEGFNLWRGNLFIEKAVYSHKCGRDRAQYYIVLGLSGSVVLMWPLEAFIVGKNTFFAMRCTYDGSKPISADAPQLKVCTSWANWKGVPTSVASPLQVQLECKRVRGTAIPAGILFMQTGKDVEVIEHAARHGFVGVEDKVCKQLAEDLEIADPPCGRVPLLAALVNNILGCSPEQTKQILTAGLEEVLEPSRLLSEADLDSVLLPEDKSETVKEAMEREDKLAELKIRQRVQHSTR